MSHHPHFTPAPQNDSSAICGGWLRNILATATAASGRFCDARDGRSTGSVSIACDRRAEFDGPKD